MVTKRSASTGFDALVTTWRSATAKSKVSPPSAPRWTPHPYQKTSVKFLVERGAAALLLEPGLGKTSISYAALKVLKKAGMLKGALVVAPRRVAVSTWPQEQQEWADFHELKVVVLHGDRKEDRVQERADIYVINYEGLPWLERSGNLAALIKKGWVDVLIIDELSKVKHISSGRHKLIARHAHLFARRWGLTGSPASNGLLDVFGQAFILDFGNALGKFYTHFRWNFFYPSSADSDFPVWLPKPGAEELIYERMKPLALRFAAKGNVKMPELITVPLPLELDAKSRKVYDNMEDNFFSVLDGLKVVTAVNSAAMSSKCRQLATGAVYDDPIDPLTGVPPRGPRKWNLVHDLKVECMLDRIDELQGQPLFIVYDFGHDKIRILEALEKAYGWKNVPVIGGGTTDKVSLAHEAAWCRNEYIVMLIHPQSVGHGLNFQKGGAHHFFFFTTGYNFEDYDQTVRRLWRQGNKAEKVFVHIPMVRDTVEEAVLASHRTKNRTQNNLLEALGEYRARRRSGG